PRKCGPLDPDAFASAQEFLRVGDTAMWRPGHVLRNGRITSIVVEDDLRVRNSGRFGQEPRGLPRSFRCRHLSSGRAIAVVSGAQRVRSTTKLCAVRDEPDRQLARIRLVA